MERNFAVSGWLRDLASFAVLVVIASWQGWEAKDLIWALYPVLFCFFHAGTVLKAVFGRFPGSVKKVAVK